MVEIKLERQEILFRILYVGRKESTKFAVMRAIQDQLKSKAEDHLLVLHAGGDRVVSFRHDLGTDQRLYDLSLAFDLLTIPGELKTPANEELLLRAADAIVWLDDGDPSGADECFSQCERVLGRLTTLRRAPDDLPVFVQGYDDAMRVAGRRYRRMAGGWRPVVRGLREGGLTAADVVKDVEAAVLERYRVWEQEMRSRGMPHHIRIRDRIYEKICLTADCTDDEIPAMEPEMRLIKAMAPPAGRHFTIRWVVATLLLLVAAAAAAASFYL